MKLRITNKISPMVFMPNITTNHAITYANTITVLICGSLLTAFEIFSPSTAT